MSLESELREQKVSHLDLSGFSLAASGTAVRDVLSQMRNAGANVCLVVESESLKGIFTDRDVLRRVMGNATVLDQPIDQVMTANPTTVSPTASAAEALRLMDENHFRNLPVVGANGEIVGNMTHQAIVAYLAARYPQEVLNRSPHPDRFPRKAEGG